MSAGLRQVIENMKDLSSGERAFIAHCLISSLETKQDEGVDEAWTELSEKRLMELQSGDVKGVSWSDIKNKITGRNG